MVHTTLMLLALGSAQLSDRLAWLSEQFEAADDQPAETFRRMNKNLPGTCQLNFDVILKSGNWEGTDYDLEGGTALSAVRKTPTFDDCADRCYQTDGCVAWNWRKMRMLCYLVSQEQFDHHKFAILPNDDFISGGPCEGTPAPAPETPIELGVCQTGGHCTQGALKSTYLEGFAAGTQQAECQKICMLDDNCTFYAWRKTNNWCGFYSGSCLQVGPSWRQGKDLPYHSFYDSFETCPEINGPLVCSDEWQAIFGTSSDCNFQG